MVAVAVVQAAVRSVDKAMKVVMHQAVAVVVVRSLSRQRQLLLEIPWP